MNLKLAEKNKHAGGQTGTSELKCVLHLHVCRNCHDQHCLGILKNEKL